MIDHPLDPANRYLYHSFVESDEMKNIYDGVIKLDASGSAVVELPTWFEAVNMDFRYQLTSIGAPGPGLYVAEEVDGNKFKIAGGTPGMKVSWMLTGVRHDPYSEKYRIQVDVAKPEAERGTYIHPEVYGQSPVKSVLRRNTPLESTTETGPNAISTTAVGWEKEFKAIRQADPKNSVSPKTSTSNSTATTMSSEAVVRSTEKKTEGSSSSTPSSAPKK
jgi:hypothetical protein